MVETRKGRQPLPHEFAAMMFFFPIIAILSFILGPYVGWTMCSLALAFWIWMTVHYTPAR